MAKAPEARVKTKRSLFLKILDRIFYSSHWLLAGLTIIALFAPRISPKVNTIPAFCNLLFPALIIGLIVCMVYWLIRKRLRFIYPLVTILISMHQLGKTVSLHFAEKEMRGNNMSLLTYNVKKFYSDKKDTGILGLIANKNPDVIFFQEFVAYNVEGKNRVNILTPLLDSLGYKYFYFKEHGNDFSLKVSGAGIVSKYPILNARGMDFYENNTNSCVYSDLVKGKDTFRIICVHFQSINLTEGKTDSRLVRDLGLDDQEKINKNRRRLAVAFKQRATQVERVAELVRQSPYPAILAGDFNDTPLSYTYGKLTSQLQDAFVLDGLGLGTTYAGAIPLLRIDYIMPDSIFTVSDFEVIKKEYSDHYPVFCKVHWP